jgi:hypothetical protein
MASTPPNPSVSHRARAICGPRCAFYAMVVLGLIIAHQTRIRPYKYDKHNACAIQVSNHGSTPPGDNNPRMFRVVLIVGG